MTKYKGRQVVMSTLKDISERKSMERKLKEAEYKYRSLVEGSLTGVYIYQNEKVIYVNPYIEELTGYSSHEISAMNFLELVLNEDRTKVINIIQEMENGKEQAFEELRVVKSDGSIICIQSWIAKTIYNELPALIGTLIDITERKEAEAKISYMAYHNALTDLPNRSSLKWYAAAFFPIHWGVRRRFHCGFSL